MVVLMLFDSSWGNLEMSGLAGWKRGLDYTNMQPSRIRNRRRPSRAPLTFADIGTMHLK
jgi:hypothetical protein